MENINPEVNNAALFCARATFKGSNLTVSVNGRGKAGLIETVLMFQDYFSDNNPGKQLSKIELFLSEGDMHAEKTPFQTTHFKD